MPFAHSEKAVQMQKLAMKLGTLGPRPAWQADRQVGWPPEETSDPNYQVPAGLPPGSKVIGFRRVPSPPTVEEHKEGAPEVSGRVVHSNAILQPSRVYSAQPSDVVQAEGVYPIMRPPVGVTTNLLDRPLTQASANHWTAPVDFGEARSYVRTASESAPSEISSRKPAANQEAQAASVVDEAARAIVSLLHGPAK
ncbi:unnamed protein product [Symbiodinium pilosum]|uniref:Uncharacterized protein n=1 Tax=Symbiodinium pilosum TaxID=2952 RepID=A0A812XQ95_SYMPI|nr:unnamed protein product [Symbiodinium pilosum]